MTDTDSAIVNQWFQRRDPEAFKAILLRYSGMVYATCRRVLSNTADAEDVTQECFEALIQVKSNPSPYLGCWLHRVATNLSLKRIRTEARRRTREKAFHAAHTAHADAEWDEIYALVDEAIAGLPDRFRVPVVAYFLEDRKQTDIASELGLAQSTVAYRITQGVARIGKSLKKRGVIAPASLAALLGANLAHAETLPAPLSASLGKLALSQSAKAIAAKAGAGGAVGKLAAMLGPHPYLATMAAVAVLGTGLYLVFGPHPVRGPAKTVSAAEQAKHISATTKPPITEKFPQLKAKAMNPARPPAGAATEALQSAPASVSGRVSDAETGAPIAGATVHLTVAKMKGLAPQEGTEQSFQATSATDGHYRIPDVRAAGDILLFASAVGYCSAQSDLEALLPGKDHDGADFKLKAATGSIGGRVVNQTRTPIPGAIVEVIRGPDSPRPVAVSDAAGAFSIAIPVDVECVLRAAKDGYGTERFTGVQPGMERFELTLLQAGAIVGRVTDRQGRPKVNAAVNVSIDPSASPNPNDECTWMVTATTGENGQYRMDNLSPSYAYTVSMSRSVRKDLPPPQKLEGLAAYVRHMHEQERKLERAIHVKSPGAAIAEQTGVRVRAGADVTVDLQVNDSDTKAALVYGRVTDPESGAPACPINVRAYGDESVKPASYLLETTTDLDGSYELYFPKINTPQKIWIGVGWDYTAAAASVEADPDLPKELNLKLSAPIVVPVECVDASGAPVMEAKVASQITDELGRATIYGLAPFVTQALSANYEIEFPKGTGVTQQQHLGISAPFSGKPGETLPTIVIPCINEFGGIRGQFVMPPDAEKALARTPFGGAFVFLTIRYDDENEAINAGLEMDRSYRFVLEKAAAKKCSLSFRLVTSKAKSTSRWWADLDSVEIMPNQVTDLGLVTLSVSE